MKALVVIAMALISAQATAVTRPTMDVERDAYFLNAHKPAPGQVLARCDMNLCYDVSNGQYLDLGQAPDGYMLVWALDDETPSKDK